MGDVVVITGASGGVGRATARRFADDGAKIALLARGEVGLEGAATEIEERGGKALILPTDVADAEQVEAAADEAESQLGPIDMQVWQPEELLRLTLSSVRDHHVVPAPKEFIDNGAADEPRTSKNEDTHALA